MLVDTIDMSERGMVVEDNNVGVLRKQKKKSKKIKNNVGAISDLGVTTADANAIGGDISVEEENPSVAETSKENDKEKVETEEADDVRDTKKKKKEKKEGGTHSGKSIKDGDEDMAKSMEKKKKKLKTSHQDEQQIIHDAPLDNNTIAHPSVSETRDVKVETRAAGGGDCDVKGKKKGEGGRHRKKSNKDSDENSAGSVEKRKQKKLKRGHQDERHIMQDDPLDASANEARDTRKVVEAISHAPGENSVDKIKRKKKSKRSDENAAVEGVGVTKTDVREEMDEESRTDKGKIRKRKRVKSGDSSEDPTPQKSEKRVRFSGHVETFPSSDPSDEEELEIEEDNLLRGKRFSKLEDEMVKEAVHKYIELHNLGEEGLEMILNSKSHPELRGCWKEIGSDIPYRPYTSVYYRAQVLFRRSESRKWTEEEYEIVLKFQKKNGNKWKALADELGKHRFHVKDTWRRLKLPNLNKGRWTQEEYQELFDLVNIDLRLKLSEEKKSKYGMIRDNIAWTAISDKLSTRTGPNCCLKWYDQLTSPMVAKGEWADTDDYRLIDALFELDASCTEDVDWDNLIDHRSGEICRKRWNQMVHHLGEHENKAFSEQVEVLAKRYCPDLLEVREAWDSKPYTS